MTEKVAWVDIMIHTMRVVRYWSGLSREVVNASALKMFNSRLDEARNVSLPIAGGLELD